MAEILIKPDEVPAGKIPVSVEGGCEWQDAPTGGGTPSSSVAEETDFGIMPIAGVLTTFSRGDHTHGSPADPVPAHEIAYNHGLLHSNSLDHSNALDHVAVHDNTQHSAAYQMVSEKAQANGYASLDATGKVPTVNLGGAGADATKYLRGDQSWQVPTGGAGGDGEVTVVMLADVPNATVNLANATGLSFIALANSTYIIEAFLVWDASVATVGIKVSATATNSPTIMSGHFIADAVNGTPDGSTYNANDVVVTTSASPFTTGNLGQLAAVLKTGVSASTWQLRFAAETTGTITLKAGSTIRYRKVA